MTLLGVLTRSHTRHPSAPHRPQPKHRGRNRGLYQASESPSETGLSPVSDDYDAARSQQVPAGTPRPWPSTFSAGINAPISTSPVRDDTILAQHFQCWDHAPSSTSPARDDATLAQHFQCWDHAPLFNKSRQGRRDPSPALPVLGSTPPFSTSPGRDDRTYLVPRATNLTT